MECKIMLKIFEYHYHIFVSRWRSKLITQYTLIVLNHILWYKIKTYSVVLSPEYLSEKCKQSITSEYLLIYLTVFASNIVEDTSPNSLCTLKLSVKP